MPHNHVTEISSPPTQLGAFLEYTIYCRTCGLTWYTPTHLEAEEIAAYHTGGTR